MAAMRPSHATAAAVGALSAIALLVFRLWMASRGPDSTLSVAAYWVLAVALLVVAPAYYGAIGRQQQPLARQWFKDPAAVARVMAMANRMIVWFLAFVAGSVLLQFLRS